LIKHVLLLINLFTVIVKIHVCTLSFFDDRARLFQNLWLERILRELFLLHVLSHFLFAFLDKFALEQEFVFRLDAFFPGVGGAVSIALADDWLECYAVKLLVLLLLFFDLDLLVDQGAAIHATSVYVVALRLRWLLEEVKVVWLVL